MGLSRSSKICTQKCVKKFAIDFGPNESSKGSKNESLKVQRMGL